MGKRLDTFADYALKMDQYVFSDMDAIINDASQYHTYTFFEAFKRKKNIQSGNGIKDYIELTKANSAEWAASNHKFNPVSDDGSVEQKFHWARLVQYIYYDEEEVEDDGDKMVSWKAIYKGKRIRKTQDTYDTLEAALWAAPVNEMNIPVGNTAVASSTPRRMMSIPAYITNTADSVYVPTEFTTSATILNVNPTTYANWRNQDFEFTPGSFEAQIEDLLFEAYYMSTWNVAGGPQDGMMTGTPRDGCVMYCDLASVKKMRRILRDSNDRLTQLGQYDKTSNFSQSTEGILNYMGKPFIWAEPLGDANTSEANQVIYGVNWNFLYPIVRKGRFMKLVKSRATGAEFEFPDQPTARVLYEFTDVNLWCSSRRRQFKIRAA
jgi:hypothetical protein